MIPYIAQLLEYCAGNLPAYAWPGGYPVYYLMRDGDICCAPCATMYADDAVGSDIHYEGEPINCDECGAEIDSAYGNPDAEEATYGNDE